MIGIPIGDSIDHPPRTYEHKMNNRNRFRRALVLLCFAAILMVVEATKAQRTEPEIRVWTENPMIRIQPETPPGLNKSIEIAAARNEVESFQVLIFSPRKLEGVSASVSDLEDGHGNHIGKSRMKLFRQEYVYVRNPSPSSTEPPGWWPDALVPFVDPYDGKPVTAMRFSREEEAGRVTYQLSGARFPGNLFTVWPGRNQGLWVDVAIPADAVAGDYSGKFTVTLPESGAISLPMKLTVWNFTLPEGPPIATHFGALEAVTAKHALTAGSPQAIKIQERYAAALEEHRIAAPVPSVLQPPIKSDGSIDWKKTHEGLKRFMSAHRTGPYQIPSYPHPRFQGSQKKKLIRYLQSFYEYLKSQHWEEGVYYYPLDEPNSKEAYDRVKAYARLVHEAEPRIRFLCTEQPYPQDSSWGTLQGSVDIWCPLFSFFDETSASHAIQNGNDIWAYTALCQKSPPYHPQFAKVSGQPTLFWQIDFPLLNYRLPLWMNWHYHIRGLLYWSAVHWGNPERDVWTDPAFRNRYNGEGYLFYPGTDVGIQGPVTSVRLKALREGLEDYAYFALLGRLGENNEADREVSRIVTSWWKWDENPLHLYQARAAIAKRILEKQSKAEKH